MAGAGAGARHPDRRRPRRVPGEVRRGRPQAGAARRGGRLLGPHAEEDQERAEAEGAVHGHRGRRGHVERLGVLPLPRRLAGERHPGRRGHRQDRQGRGGARPGLIPGRPGPPADFGRWGPWPVPGPHAICCLA
ncbi:hypothetical protein SGPA1_20335 [Streptomyces misionensis JCM 4497]